ncbi:mttA/Hcf106 family protein [Mycobacterium kansasii]|uniref:Sec-independent protein translocase protein TatA n=1 Tax=Mycobacterium kansasii TaxID=1768 RepID=A0A1V3WCX4_MYCKA|nr:mttA/Hcf106 family protein [Mycobacterium kansasii]
MVIVLFGAKKLPDAARSLGKSMRIFKSEMREMQSETKNQPPALDTNPASQRRCSRNESSLRRALSRVTPRRGRLSPAPPSRCPSVTDRTWGMVSGPQRVPPLFLNG